MEAKSREKNETAWMTSWWTPKVFTYRQKGPGWSVQKKLVNDGLVGIGQESSEQSCCLFVFTKETKDNTSVITSMFFLNEAIWQLMRTESKKVCKHTMMRTELQRLPLSRSGVWTLSHNSLGSVVSQLPPMKDRNWCVKDCGRGLMCPFECQSSRIWSLEDGLMECARMIADETELKRAWESETNEYAGEKNITRLCGSLSLLWNQSPWQW